MIRLLVADDHPVVREGLKRIVAACEDMRVVGEARDGEEALATSRATPADVLLLDLSMPGPGFLETLRRLRVECPALRVLVLSVHPEEDYAARALKAGASGYLTKDHSPEELANAIRCVHEGGRYLSPGIGDRLRYLFAADEGRPPHTTLSEREFQVFRLLASGKSIKEIGATLGLSPKTVSTYRTRVLQKLQAKGNADLVRYAVTHQLDGLP